MPRQTSFCRTLSHFAVCVPGAVAVLTCLISILPLDAADSTPVSFSRDIAPILQQKCVTCHNPEKAKGGYRLHAFEALLKPGESHEPAITPGQPAKSKLLQLLTATDADDRMPQKDDPLPAAQIALIERWIAAGAKFDGSDPKAPLAALFAPAQHPLPPAVYPRPVPTLALAFSPDGKQLAASGHHEITIWNPEKGTLLRRIQNLPRQIQALSFSPDGSVLAACGGTPGRLGEAQLLDPATGLRLKTLATASDFLLALAFSPDGQHVIIGGADNAIRVVQVATGKEERRIEQHADWIASLAFSPDGKHFASASRDKTARLFDAATGELEETYDGHGAPVFGVAFSPDNKFVLSAGRDRELHGWLLKDAKKLFERGGYEGDVLRLAVAGDRLFSASADRQVREYKFSDKKADLVRTYSGHHDVVYALALHAASQRLASGAFDGEIRLWDTADGKLLTNFSAVPVAMPATPSARTP